MSSNELFYDSLCGRPNRTVSLARECRFHDRKICRAPNRTFFGDLLMTLISSCALLQMLRGIGDKLGAAKAARSDICRTADALTSNLTQSSQYYPYHFFT